MRVSCAALSDGEARPPLRRDAARNRELLLRAAAAEVRDNGDEATVSRIAGRAGLGIGTVYRHFPGREDLLHAAAASVIGELADELAMRCDSSAEAGAFYGAVIDVALSFGRPRAAADVLRRVSAPGRPLGALAAPMARLLRQAQAAGAVRAELDDDDLWPLVVMVAAISARIGRDALGRSLWLFCAPAHHTAGSITQEEDDGSWK